MSVFTFLASIEANLLEVNKVFNIQEKNSISTGLVFKEMLQPLHELSVL